ncbi:universal stress protein [Actinomycetospora cinnamomea]|uniref:Nucleotide-binding universal stress UspA family protein n=1 Tax=Actinomycetospora cinnamomea TaxID=663609 RepID=A0A2U1F2I8_9PSEU|nr:universal stress protein [Actinomycetospora cinnamomea]PVZ06386.1 nucleotide-binding universal stress UspA family protein [Actinomycetospora cinnamomea]
MSEERGPLVVAGVDGSPHGDVALRYALEEVARRGGRLLAVSAWERPELTLSEFYGLPMHDENKIHAAHEKDTRERVDRMMADHPELAGVTVEVRAQVGRPADVLVEAARDADLLVVGHRGRGGLRSVALGSVGLGCVLHAPCPVLVVPASKEDAEAEAR